MRHPVLTLDYSNESYSPSFSSLALCGARNGHVETHIQFHTHDYIRSATCSTHSVLVWTMNLRVDTGHCDCQKAEVSI